MSYVEVRLARGLSRFPTLILFTCGCLTTASVCYTLPRTAGNSAAGCFLLPCAYPLHMGLDEQPFATQDVVLPLVDNSADETLMAITPHPARNPVLLSHTIQTMRGICIDGASRIPDVSSAEGRRRAKARCCKIPSACDITVAVGDAGRDHCAAICGWHPQPSAALIHLFVPALTRI